MPYDTRYRRRQSIITVENPIDDTNKVSVIGKKNKKENDDASIKLSIINDDMEDCQQPLKKIVRNGTFSFFLNGDTTPLPVSSTLFPLFVENQILNFNPDLQNQYLETLKPKTE